MAFYQQMIPLTDAELQRKAPSIFATRPWEGMSNRYSFIPTIDVIRKMRAEGFFPYSADQSLSRVTAKGDFTKHMIRFRQHLSSYDKGDLVTELCLTNAHDGSSQYVLTGGIWRFVCGNGMMVSDGEFEGYRVRHTGNTDSIIEASFELVEEFPKILGQVETFKTTKLLPEAAETFATAAVMLRYEPTIEMPSPVTPMQILQPRRPEDADPTLWNVFNTIQEHLIRGGLEYRTAANRHMTTKPVKSITANANLNQRLWRLASAMARRVN